MMSGKRLFYNLFMCILALCIPAMLVCNALQAHKYADLERQIEDLEKRQQDLVDENKKLITDISLLSGSERVETIAEDELYMRKAETDEIIRVEMTTKEEK